MFALLFIFNNSYYCGRILHTFQHKRFFSPSSFGIQFSKQTNKTHFIPVKINFSFENKNNKIRLVVDKIEFLSITNFTINFLKTSLAKVRRLIFVTKIVIALNNIKLRLFRKLI